MLSSILDAGKKELARVFIRESMPRLLNDSFNEKFPEFKSALTVKSCNVDEGCIVVVYKVVNLTIVGDVTDRITVRFKKLGSSCIGVESIETGTPVHNCLLSHFDVEAKLADMINSDAIVKETLLLFC